MGTYKCTGCAAEFEYNDYYHEINIWDKFHAVINLDDQNNINSELNILFIQILDYIKYN